MPKMHHHDLDDDYLEKHPEVADAAEAYTDKHWGHKPQDRWTHSSKLFPDHMTQMGHLMGLGIIRVRSNGRSGFRPMQEPLEAFEAWKAEDFDPVNVPGEEEGIVVLDFPRRDDSMVCFDEDQALWLVLPEAVRHRMRNEYRDLFGKPIYLSDLALLVGGKRNKRKDYPKVKIVLILGELAWTMYRTTKGNYTTWVGSKRLGRIGQDGQSDYVHPGGEEGGIRSLVGMDKDGNLWLAGGDYTVETGGIGD
jgi:hypothetical protein